MDAVGTPGVPPADAIRGATVHAAELLGVEDRGVVVHGRLADLIAVRGDPLQDVRVLEDVRFVMKWVASQRFKSGHTLAVA